MPGISLESCVKFQTFLETKQFCMDGETNDRMQSINFSTDPCSDFMISWKQMYAYKHKINKQAFP